MNITNTHKQNKGVSYWDDLVGGTTSQYKEKVMERLITEHLKIRGGKLLDIGCGRCETILKYAKLLKAQSLTCLDYDAQIIEKMKQKFPNENIIWKVADIFDTQGWTENFNLIFLMDMLHEIYSFYGRLNKDIQYTVNHDLGKQSVAQVITNISRLANKGGGIVITDNVLCPENIKIRVLMKNAETKEAVMYFLKHYPTKKFDLVFEGEQTLRINSRDFCVLLTQYNKIKRKDFDRWNVERFEVHQYMTLKEYEELFRHLNFEVHAVIDTPQSTRQEWESDFRVLEGLAQIPEKRITLLAIKQ
jgi:cyclopropane fatty-acyl-phospholipid synthase-like methyltransferase